MNDKRHGKGFILSLIICLGLIIYKNSRLYEGEWENDLKHGKGFEIF